MTDTYRVGIIGCGTMGRSHLRAYAENPATDIVAAMDVNQEPLNGFVEEFSVPAAYTDYHQMLAEQDLDVVSITTWQCAHKEPTVAAAEAGVKAILCEKPVAASLGEADDMIAACDAHQVKLVIGHMNRFCPTLNEVRRLVADGAIGQPLLVYHRARPVSGLLNSGTHAIDSWRYSLSDPETLWVIAQTARFTDRWERRSYCEDLCAGIVCFAGGIRGVYEQDLPEPGMMLPPAPAVAGNPGWATSRDLSGVTGSDGKIALRPDGHVLLHQDHRSGWQEITPEPLQTDQLKELIHWMDGSVAEHRSTGHQARYTMEIMMAIYESLRIKNVVAMPLRTRQSPLDMMVEDGTLPVIQEGAYDLRAPFPEQSWSR